MMIQGTEPPEPAHRKPDDPSLISKTDLDPNDPNREREEGEVKSGERWEFPVAQARAGNLWGTIEESRGGKRILAFRGIPYAKPPTAELRFFELLLILDKSDSFLDVVRLIHRPTRTQIQLHNK